MKIYKVTVNEVAPIPAFSISGNFRAERTERRSEYYLSRDNAEYRCKQIYDGFQNLIGFVPMAEAVISEIEVIE